MNILIGTDADTLRGGKARAAFCKRCGAHMLSNGKVLGLSDTVCRKRRNVTISGHYQNPKIKKCVHYYA